MMTTPPQSEIPNCEQLERLSRRVNLSEVARRTAAANWERTSEAIRNGADGNNVTAIRGRYLQIRRLADEARRIILKREESGETTYVYAIDPHLIRGYCAYWVQSHFTSYDFVSTEWNKGEERSRIDFFVFLLGAILRTDGLICLNAGRSEISEMLGYFLQYHERGPVTEQHLELFDKALEEIVSTTGAREKFNWTQDQISDFIWEKFDALVSAGGIPLMAQSLSQARLAVILRGGRLKSSFAALRDRLGPEHATGLARAEQLFHSFSRNAERSREARTRLYEAYTTFGRLGDIGGTGLVSERVADFRPGEYANINALSELRLLNACLMEAGLDAEVRYITSSQAMYAFVSAFDPDSIGVELTHPRHLFIFENRATADNLQRFEQVLTRTNAYVHAVPRDNVISSADLDRFDREFASILRDVRSTYSFASVDSEQDRRALASVITQFALNHTQAAEKYQPLLHRISKSLAATSVEVAEEFNRNLSTRTAHAFGAYREFVAALEGGSGSTQLLTRAFGIHAQNDGGDGDEPVPRVVCIAVNGGYRNLFKLYYPPLLDCISSTAGEMITLEKLLDLTEAAVGNPESSSSEGRAQLEFMRASYAMAHSEWLLALNLAQAALDQLGDLRDGGDGDAPLSLAERQSQLIGQETLILMHSARRGIASNLDALPRRYGRLMRAAPDLYRSAVATQSFDDRASFSTEYNPNSVRQAIGAVAFTIEWLALKEATVTAGITLHKLPGDNPLLPPAKFSHVAWADLRIASSSLRSLFTDPHAIEILLGDAELLASRVQAIFESVVKSEGRMDHSADFWRYILLKALALKLIIHLMILLRILPAADGALSSTKDLDRFARLLEEHDHYALTRQVGDSAANIDTHPFSNFVLDALRYIRMDREVADSTTLAQINKSLALLGVTKFHYELSSHGFARTISQAFVSTYGPKTAKSLGSIAAALERESSFKHPYAT